MSKIITAGMLGGTVAGIPVNTSLPCDPGNYNQFGSRNVAYIVMHYTGNSADKAKSNANYFNSSGDRGASAHFFVDETSIWQSVRLRDMAWHFSSDEYFHPKCRNFNSIGIEMCTSGGYKVSEKTKENAAQLCAEMCKLIDISAEKVDEHVFRHWDMTRKNCPAQMAGDGNQEWAGFKARVKAILNKANIKEEVEMTAAEIKKLIQEESAKAVKAALDKQNKVYSTLEEVPAWAREDIRALMEQRAIKGTGNGVLGMTLSEIKNAVIAKRIQEASK